MCMWTGMCGGCCLCSQCALSTHLLPGAMPCHAKTACHAPCVMPQVGEGDSLGWAAVCEPGDGLLIATSTGRVLLMPSSLLRPKGRVASTVKVWVWQCGGSGGGGVCLFVMVGGCGCGLVRS